MDSEEWYLISPWVHVRQMPGGTPAHDTAASCTLVPHKEAEQSCRGQQHCVCVLGGVGGAIPKHLAWQRCGSDKDGVANRTCQVWPTAGTGHEDDSWESCWTIGQTYRDHGGAELTAQNADSA